MIKLWRKNQYGLGTWRIWADGDMVHYAHAITEGGQEVIHSQKIELNNSGRTLEQQSMLEMKSRISRQMDKGYKATRAEAEAGATNQLGLRNPMLAQPLEKVKLYGSINGYVQRKYDGHRCLITKTGGEILAYTRRGKVIDSIPHILNDVVKWLPDGYTLDGELYIHGVGLQGISSFIKRVQHGSSRLCYHWYDIVTNDPFGERLREMRDLAGHIGNNCIQPVETLAVERMADVYEYFRQFRSEGYEGAMLRRDLRGYEDSRRSDQLIKVKERADCEVTVLGIRPSKDGWAICQVRTDWDTVFDISAPGSVPEKTRVLHQSDKYLGRRLTIEYAGLTADKIPFHAVAIRWRDDL
jgi:DNA ligase-1